VSIITVCGRVARRYAAVESADVGIGSYVRTPAVPEYDRKPFCAERATTERAHDEKSS